jgi:hypothetical protein
MRPWSWSWSLGRTEALVALLLAAACGAAPAQTLLQGSVTDGVTGVPLSGVDVEVQRDGAAIGRAVTTPAGAFVVTVNVGNQPSAVNLKLLFRREDYRASDQNAVVASGRPQPATFPVALVREEVAACRAARERRVVVGHFRPPTAVGGNDFGARVADTVRFELARFQQTRIAADQLPMVLSCERIDERENLPAMAKALQADALLAGTVSRAPGTRFNVAMFVGDQHGLFNATGEPITSRNIDLDDPSATRIDRAASTAIVLALLKGYQKANRPAECVELSAAAGALLGGTLPQPIVDVRAECQRALPARGLTR